MVLQDEADKVAYEILSKYHVIAVVGCSRNEGKPSHDVPAYLQSVGYRIIPVNPSADEILGEKAYKSLLEIGFPVDVVDVFRPSPETVEIAKQAVAIKAKALWLQEGIFNDEAKKIAEDNGMLFIMNRCMMKEHYKLF
ncbi:CoA-binding protein [Candidatus Marsarchaeota archaeon]|nr:CoA-binding protein [Candidatus Marsarchaeota archaeon]MCL5405024.1 CoA-binding protein [Candidatus Marsarchaeota archaeon]